MKNAVLLCGAIAVAAVAGLMVKTDPPAAMDAAVAPAGAPSQSPLAAPPADASLAGAVLETMNVAQYTYLRLATRDRGEQWAAVSLASVPVGAQVSIVDAARMTNFESATLKRTFDVIYFGSLGEPARASGMGSTLPPGHPRLDGANVEASPHGAPAAPSPAGTELPAPAGGENGRAIAAVFEQRSALEGKAIRVRGRVVKATAVQGVTYYRLRDRSSETAGSAELVVSSSAQAATGEVVTFEGAVRTDVDVGIGFKYPVMLQDARRIE